MDGCTAQTGDQGEFGCDTDRYGHGTILTPQDNALTAPTHATFRPLCNFYPLFAKVGATSRERGPVEPRLPLPLSMVVIADEGDEDVLFQDVLPSPIERARQEAYMSPHQPR